MITKEIIEGRVSALQKEIDFLKTTHDRMVADRNQKEKEFQDQAVLNQNRFQQLSGALAQLTELLNQTNGAQDPAP